MSPTTAVAPTGESSVPVNPEQTLKACKALVAHIKKAAAAPPKDGKQNLLADEETVVAETPVWLTLTTKNHIHDSNRTLQLTSFAERCAVAGKLKRMCHGAHTSRAIYALRGSA